jgi:TRAP transporter TAXI family solute receptor
MFYSILREAFMRSTKPKHPVYLATAALSVALLSACGGGGSQAGGEANSSGGTHRLAAINSTSSHYIYVTQVTDAINKAGDQRWNVLETGGIADNHVLLEQGEADVAISAPATMYQAVNGVDSFEDVGPNEELRALWTWVLPPQNMVARADAGVSSFADLEGEPVLAGGTGTSTETIFKTIFEILEVKPKFVSGSLEDGVTNMQDGRVVAFGKASPGLVPDSTYLQMQSSIELAPVGLSQEETEKIKAEVPYLDFIDVPADTVIPGAPEFTTWVAPLMFVTNADFPEEDAYQAVKAAVEAQEQISETYKGTASVDYMEDTIANAVTAETPLHPGALRYFEEQGAEIPEEIRP